MAPSGLSISVVIPSVGRAVLREVVSTVLAQDPLEVLVVADRSRDRVDAALAPDLTADARLRVLPGDGRGSAAARQIGVDAAAGDVVLLLDDDVVPEAGLLAGHVTAHADGPGQEIVVGFMPVAAELRAANATARIYDNDYRAEVAQLEAGVPVLDQLWGGNLSMRRADAARVPQFDPAFPFTFREDEEFGLRARRAGLTGRFVRALRATHHYQRSASRFVTLAADQRRARLLMQRLHPELGPEPPPTAGLPTPLRIVASVATAPIVGPPLRHVVLAAARRFGDGPPRRVRVALLVLARALVQVDAARG